MSNYFWSLEKAAAEIKKDQVLTASVEIERETRRERERETRRKRELHLISVIKLAACMCPAWTMRTLFHSNALSQHLTIDWCSFTQIIRFYISRKE